MFRVPRLLVFLVGLGVLLPASQTDAFAAKGQRAKPAKKKVQPVATAPAPVVPSGPLTPLTLQQTPAIPAQVDFQNGQLTITARNSSLGDILRMVHTRTGATMDFPPNVTERVMGQFGPGPARDVLASLLSGSSFNYAIVGSPANPAAMDKVIITRNTGGPTPAASVPGAVAGMRPQLPTPQEQADELDSDNQGAPSEEMIPADDEQTGAQDQGNGQPDNRQGEGVIKTPEQLLQELQRQQQMQQQQMQIQQQQQQGGAPQGLPSPEQQQRPEN